MSAIAKSRIDPELKRQAEAALERDRAETTGGIGIVL